MLGQFGTKLGLGTETWLQIITKSKMLGTRTTNLNFGGSSVVKTLDY